MHPFLKIILNKNTQQANFVVKQRKIAFGVLKTQTRSVPLLDTCRYPGVHLSTAQKLNSITQVELV